MYMVESFKTSFKFYNLIFFYFLLALHCTCGVLIKLDTISCIALCKDPTIKVTNGIKNGTSMYKMVPY